MGCKYLSNDADLMQLNQYIVPKNRRAKIPPRKPWPPDFEVSTRGPYAGEARLPKRWNGQFFVQTPEEAWGKRNVGIVVWLMIFNEEEKEKYFRSTPDDEGVFLELLVGLA